MQVCPPSHTVCLPNVEHQMGNPVPDEVVKVSLLRHHVAHSAKLQRRQLFHVECLDTVDDLSFRQPGQYQLCSLESKWQDGSCGRRVEANRASHLGVPKFRGVEGGHP